jgi:hypothetical protein
VYRHWSAQDLTLFDVRSPQVVREAQWQPLLDWVDARSVVSVHARVARTSRGRRAKRLQWRA